MISAVSEFREFRTQGYRETQAYQRSQRLKRSNHVKILSEPEHICTFGKLGKMKNSLVKFHILLSFLTKNAMCFGQTLIPAHFLRLGKKSI